MRKLLKYRNQQVRHEQFGLGHIVSIKGDLLRVKFKEDYQEERIFRYPLCFSQGALTLVSPDLQKEMKKGLPEKSSIILPRKNELKGYTPEGTDKEAWKDDSQLVNWRTTHRFPTYTSTASLFTALTSALEEEIEAQKRRPAAKFNLSQGIRISQAGGVTNYRFYSSKPVNMASGSLLSIQYGSYESSGILLSCDGNFVFLRTAAPLDTWLNRITIRNSPWIFNARLIESLANPVYQQKGTIAHSIITEGYDQIHDNPAAVYGQNEAIRHALHRPITLIWGPPGTGKTETLARLALDFKARGQRVLILSTSNVAVDQAMCRIAVKAGDFEPGEILRYGPGRLPEAVNHPYLTSPMLALTVHPELIAKRQQLQEELKILRRKKDAASAAEHQKVLARLQTIKAELIQDETSQLKEAGILGVTAAKALIDPLISREKFDAVIFDEASMTLLPYVFFAAGLAGRHLIICGDFNQLPPVINSRNKTSILYQDIFQYTGVVEALHGGQAHYWLQMLDTQYRMHPEISRFSNQLHYMNLLKDAPFLQKKHASIVDLPPFASHSMGLADLSRMHATCYARSGSKFNILSAFVTVFLALQAGDPAQTGVIAPYALQAELIATMFADIREATGKPAPQTATVHQFQGSERDVMIFDITDNYDRRAGPLINTRENDFSNRLINVAMTRTRGKFALVASREFIREKIHNSCTITNLMQYIAATGQGCYGSAMIEEMARVDNPCICFPDPREQLDPFFADLQKAETTIRIWIAGPITDHVTDISRLHEIVLQKQAEGVTIQLSVPRLSFLPDMFQSFAQEDRNCLNTMSIIDDQVIWFNLPHTRLAYTSTTMEKKVWSRPSYHYPVFRFAGGQTAKMLVSLMQPDEPSTGEITSDHDIVPFKNFKTYVEENTSCPECSSPLTLRTAGNSPFMGCTQFPVCSHTEKITPEFVEAYIYEMRHCWNSLGFSYRDLKVVVGEWNIYAEDAQGRKFTLDRL